MSDQTMNLKVFQHGGPRGDDSYWLVVGMIVTTPLKKITDFVNWDEIPNIYMGKYKIHGNQTTN